MPGTYSYTYKSWGNPQATASPTPTNTNSGKNWLENLLAPLREKTMAWSKANILPHLPEQMRVKEPEKQRLNLETFSPYRGLRTAAVPITKNALSAIGVNPQTTEDIAYGVRGAYNIPAFVMDPGFAYRTLQGKRPTDEFEATTERQKTAERVGQAVMGQTLAAGIPLAALPAGSSALAGAGAVASGALSRGITGAALGTGFSTLPMLKELATTGKLPAKDQILKQLKEGAVSGVENSWMLAFTDMATDKVLGTASQALAKSHPAISKMLGGLVSNQSALAMTPLKEYVKGGGTSVLTKAGLLAKGVATIFSRAMAEVPGENTMWTAMGQLKGTDQQNFVDSFYRNLPSTILGNAIYAGGNSIWGGVPALAGTDMKEIRDAAWNALKETLGGPEAQSGAINLGATIGGEAADRYIIKPGGQGKVLDVFDTDTGKVVKTYSAAQESAATNFAKNMNAKEASALARKPGRAVTEPSPEVKKAVEEINQGKVPEGITAGQIQAETQAPELRQFDELSNKGDFAGARALVDSLPDDHPYKQSMSNLLDSLHPETMAVPGGDIQTRISQLEQRIMKATADTNPTAVGKLQMEATKLGLDDNQYENFLIGATKVLQSTGVDVPELPVTPPKAVTTPTAPEEGAPLVSQEQLQKVKESILSQKQGVETPVTPAEATVTPTTPTMESARAAAESMPEGKLKDQLMSIFDDAEQFAKEQGDAALQDKYIESINTLHAGLSEEGKNATEVAIQMGKLDPKLRAFLGNKPITWGELEKLAQTATVLNTLDLSTRQEIADTRASILATRNVMAQANNTLAQTGALDNPDKIAQAVDLFKRSAELSTIASAKAAETGGNLNAYRIDANPEAKTVLDQVMKELEGVKLEDDDLKKALEGVDLSNDKQVLKVMRELKPPTLLDVAEEFRYINLLSSPKTTIINAITNLGQAGVLTPARKLASGLVDWTISQLDSNYERKHYVSEMPAYYKGMFNSWDDAWDSFKKAYSGEEILNRPDVAVHQTAGEPAQLEGAMKVFEPANKVMSYFNDKFGFIPQGLQAWDAFFQTLIKGGQLESMVDAELKTNPDADVAKLMADFDKEATDYAAEALFRGELDTTGKTRGQGYVLRGIDELSANIYQLRNKKIIGPIVKGYVPFIKTPMEILKQGLEYSPLGIATLPGSKDYADQLGKWMVGNTVTAMAYWLANKGEVTWSAPTSEKQSAEFYASGRKPYSMKVGDTWIGYSKLGPLAYPVAMAAAWKYYKDIDPSRLTDNVLERMTKVLIGTGKFFSDQSYVQGLSDLLSMVEFKGGMGTGIRALTNIPRQLIPLSSLQGWVSRLIDPIYRDVGAQTKPSDSQIVNNLIVGLPLLSMGVEPYLDPAGNPSTRKLMILNALSPVEFSPENAFFDTYFTMNGIQRDYAKIKQDYKDKKITKEQAVAAIERLTKENQVANETGYKGPAPSRGKEPVIAGGLESSLRNILPGVKPETGTPMIPYLSNLFETLGVEPPTTPTPTTTPSALPTTTTPALPTTAPTGQYQYQYKKWQ